MNIEVEYHDEVLYIGLFCAECLIIPRDLEWWWCDVATNDVI